MGGVIYDCPYRGYEGVRINMKWFLAVCLALWATLATGRRAFGLGGEGVGAPT